MKQDTNYLLKLNRSVGTLSAYPMGIVQQNCFLEKLVGGYLKRNQLQVELDVDLLDLESESKKKDARSKIEMSMKNVTEQHLQVSINQE